jgi:Mn2+/Fe2+ NRAMP family transporter
MREIISVLLLALLIYIYYRIGKYGENTSFGLVGSILLAVFLTPIFAIIILFFVKQKQNSNRL